MSANIVSNLVRHKNFFHLFYALAGLNTSDMCELERFLQENPDIYHTQCLLRMIFYLVQDFSGTQNTSTGNVVKKLGGRLVIYCQHRSLESGDLLNIELRVASNGNHL